MEREENRQESSGILFDLELTTFESEALLNSSNEIFKKRMILGLKKSLIQNISHFEMPEERKSFFIHQLQQTHSSEDLVELLGLINASQADEKHREKDFIYLAPMEAGIKWSTYRCGSPDNKDLLSCSVVGGFDSEVLNLKALNKISFIYHTPIEYSSKFQRMLKSFLDQTLQRSGDDHISKVVKKFWPQQDLLSFLTIKEVKEVIETSIDLTTLQNSDMIILGQGQLKNLVSRDLIKDKAQLITLQ